MFNLPIDCTNQPMYMSFIRNTFKNLEEDKKQFIILYLTVNDFEEYRCLKLDLPKTDFIREKHMDLIERYILATLNNLLVSFGGIKLSIYLNIKDKILLDVLKKSIAKFDIYAPENNRKGHGSYINYINRINHLQGRKNFSIEYIDISEFKIPDDKKEYRIYEPINIGKELIRLKKAAVELDGKAFCGLDIGGNSIKAAAVVDGEIVILKDYQWFPTALKTADDINNPIIMLIRFLSVYVLYKKSFKEPLAPEKSEVFKGTASYEFIKEYTEKLESLLACDTRIFDGVVIGFPDIVVNNKVAGGETYKQRGIRNNKEVGYEHEFLKMSNLDVLVKQYIKPDGKVRVLNDGNASAFIVSVEQAFSDENLIENNGLFANTIGTEMGTGFISKTGTIQDIPLECFQYTIDLGSLNESEYHSDDVRSIKNFNTNISGSVQKYVSQIGMIRLAVKNIKQKNTELYASLFEQGYLAYTTLEGQHSLIIPTEPVDKRNEFTRYLIQLLEEGNEAMEDTFREIGQMIGITIEEIKFIFSEISTTKLISGGIVASDVCLKLIKEGLKSKYPEYEVKRLDGEIITSPLLKKLDEKHRNFTSAVGSVYIINREFIEDDI